MKNKIYIVCSCLLMISCSFSQKENLPNKITKTFVLDVIPDQDAASKMAELVLLGRTGIKSLDKFKPFEVNSIVEDKVWEVVIVTIGNDKYSKPKTHKVYINKNTGEILLLWESY